MLANLLMWDSITDKVVLTMYTPIKSFLFIEVFTAWEAQDWILKEHLFKTSGFVSFLSQD